MPNSAAADLRTASLRHGAHRRSLPPACARARRCWRPKCSCARTPAAFAPTACRASRATSTRLPAATPTPKPRSRRLPGRVRCDQRGQHPRAGRRPLRRGPGVHGPRHSLSPAYMLRDTGHLGALGMHALRAAEAGRVAMILQAAPPVIAMPGALGPMLGNNPIALAAPRPRAARRRGHVVLGGGARQHSERRARGPPIPQGWAVDAEGRPTTDAQRALRERCFLPGAIRA